MYHRVFNRNERVGEGPGSLSGHYAGISFLKTHVSFSDHNLSVVLRRCRRRKLFTFSSSSPEPLDQFQRNFVQSIFG